MKPFIKEAVSDAMGTDQDRGTIQFFHGRIKDCSTCQDDVCTGRGKTRDLLSLFSLFGSIEK